METSTTLRGCGEGKRECVCYWSGPLDEPYLVDRLHHPAHRGTPIFYEVASSWLTGFWIELARDRRAARAQVHTHGGRAFHSATDDAFPLIATPEFVSLVIPRFACGAVGLSDAYAAHLVSDGDWDQLDPATAFVVSG